ncbi:MAG: MATE family efflux transporter [Deltaproteobacteria bacterium]|nr:MAG: MATE family efflux transporter [Deltaproteobacteria bacterium]
MRDDSRTSTPAKQIQAGAESTQTASEAGDDGAGTKAMMRIVEGPLPRGVFALGLPLVVAMALQATFNLVDMYIIGKLPNGTEALGALVICDLVAMVPTIIANGISNASAAIISRRAGEGDSREVSRYTWQSLSMVALMSFIFGFIGIVFADPLTGGVFGAKGEVRLLASEYMAIIVGGSFTILLLLQICAIMRALGDGRTPMFLLLGSNVANFFLSIVAAFGNGPYPEEFAWLKPVGDAIGLAPMGVAGAAWSTVFSRGVALFIGVVVLAFNRGSLLHLYLKDLIPKRRAFSRIMKIAWPNSAQFVLRIGITLFFMAIITHKFTSETDSTTLTAFGICMRLDTLVLFMGMGWGAAASTYVGQNLGAGLVKRAQQAGWWAAGYNLLFMVVIVIAYLVFADDIIKVFDDTPVVIDVGREYIRVIAVTYAFLGVAVVLSQALSGAGATLSSFAIDSVVLLAIIVPFTLVMLIFFDLSRVETWYVIAVGNVLSAVAYVAWFKRGTWVEKQI